MFESFTTLNLRERFQIEEIDSFLKNLHEPHSVKLSRFKYFNFWKFSQPCKNYENLKIQIFKKNLRPPACKNDQI